MLTHLHACLQYRRSRPVRYVVAAFTAIFVVSTLYYLEIPHHPEGFQDELREHLPHWPLPIPISGGSESKTSPPVWEERAAQVKQAFLHAYRGYLQHANGYDELRPLSLAGVNNFNGWNVTMYDSLDTMLLMDLWDEFAEALPVVKEGNFRQLRASNGNGWNKSGYVPFFETVIRYLGGLLAAYAMSGEQVLLDRAHELATILEPAFGSSAGMPRFGVNPATGASSQGVSGVLAEVASCQLEWTYVAHATGNKTHFDRVDKLLHTLANAMEQRKGGMFPTHWHLNGGKATSESRSMGAAADSGHEYLLKQYLLTGKQDVESLEMYILTANEALTRLLYLTPNRELLYVTDTAGGSFTASHNFEHLACFFPGLLALGAHTVDLNAALAAIDPSKLSAEARRQYEVLSKYDLHALHMAAAEGLTTSCWLMYADQPSGLGPETVQMRHDWKFVGEDGKPKVNSKGKLWIDAVEEWNEGGRRGPLPGLGEKKTITQLRKEDGTAQADYSVRRPDYFLRPETLESIYLMWRTTGNPVWRERGWQIFQAIEREAKTPSGYASVKQINKSPAPQSDEQPSYFLAETLKYLYLLFKNEDLVPLDKWVFNTEAHPLPVFNWSSWEKHKFGIPS
ncbi:seven-hairpin glycosidase [Cubamyces menziesii]|uniref:alpha-1,2-Mannosidase n=1 Tax=Trametes cubensis TaxID=1111947 RepID=A0AAD7X8S2_9APHY|nr:seven-hairpin glycosidase [Cubamyces menziesii]KAJ8473463.1 hypothetical protein ONZ51_g7856 [Trametes cubensis]